MASLHATTHRLPDGGQVTIANPDLTRSQSNRIIRVTYRDAHGRVHRLDGPAELIDDGRTRIHGWSQAGEPYRPTLGPNNVSYNIDDGSVTVLEWRTGRTNHRRLDGPCYVTSKSTIGWDIPDNGLSIWGTPPPPTNRPLTPPSSPHTQPRLPRPLRQ